VRNPARLRAVRPTALAACLLLAAATSVSALPARYHTYEETRAELVAAAASYPAITYLDTLGYSTTDGLAIWALKISDNASVDEDEPVVLFNGIHHAEEVLGLETCMWMIDELTSGYGVNDTITAWIDGMEIWFIPILSPDGHKVVTEGLDEGWRKNTRDNNGNHVFDLDYDGVDPNNNYDFNWSSGGSSDPSSSYYRGTAPFSENETQVMRDFCLATKPVFSLNYHSPAISAGDLIYYPWYWSGHGYCPDYDLIYDIAHELADRTKTETGSSFNAYYGYATSGKARNWQYGVLGTVGLTMEIWSYGCQPPGPDVDDFCERVSTGSYYLLDRALGPGLTGRVTDATTGLPLVATVTVLEHTSTDIEPRTTEPTYGRYYRLLEPGSYTLEFECSGYQTESFSNVAVGAKGHDVLDVALYPVGLDVPETEGRVRIAAIAPNPCRDGTTIHFVAPQGDRGTVEFYAVSGRLVARLDVPRVRGNAGVATWDGRDIDGRFVASGVYLARFLTEAGEDRAKLVVMR